MIIYPLDSLIKKPQLGTKNNSQFSLSEFSLHEIYYNIIVLRKIINFRMFDKLIREEQVDKNANSEFGINKEAQKVLANRNTQFIIELSQSKQLRLSYSLTSIALQIAARFFHMKCYIHFDRFVVLAACLLLASKSRDMEIKLKRLCFAFHSVLSRHIGSVVPVDEDKIKTIHTQLIIAESQVLRTMEYELEFICPNEYLDKYCNLYIGKTDPYRSKIEQTTKIITLDSHRVQCSLYFHPLVIFLSSFLIACRYLNIKPYVHSSIQKHCSTEFPNQEEMYHKWLQIVFMNEGILAQADKVLQCIQLLNSLIS